MIYDFLDNFSLYLPVHKRFPLVSSFIHSHDVSSFENGVYPIAQGVSVIINEYRTDEVKNKFIECHKRNIDIQIVLSGIERVGICHKNSCQIVQEYDDEKDFEKLGGTMDFVTLQEGNFGIFFPQDGHMPGVQFGATAHDVKKAVFKVPV